MVKKVDDNICACNYYEIKLIIVNCIYEKIINSFFIYSDIKLC